MTKYATMNPLGSTSPYDLFDNAQNFDIAFNTITAAIWQDRLGKSRHTWHGLETMAKVAIAAFGYITMDSFQDGATLTLPNQVLRDTSTGEYYRWDGSLLPAGKVVPKGSTPASTGGISIGAWLSVGDAALRSDLAKPSGAGFIGGLAKPVTWAGFAGGASIGSSDNQAQILAALSSGLEVSIPAGSYKSSAVAVAVATAVSVKGAPGKSKITQVGAGNLLLISTPSTGAVISDVEMTLNAGSSRHGLAMVDQNGARVRSVKVTGLDTIGTGVIAYSATGQVQDCVHEDISVYGDRANSTNTNGWLLVDHLFSRVCNILASGIKAFAIELKNAASHNAMSNLIARNSDYGLYYGSDVAGKNPSFNVATGVVTKDCDTGYVPGGGSDNVLAGALFDMRGSNVTSSTAAVRIGSEHSVIYGGHVVGTGNFVRYEDDAKNNYTQMSFHPTSTSFNYVVYEVGSERNALEITHPGALNNSVRPNVPRPAGMPVSGPQANPVWCHATGEYLGTLGPGWLWQHDDSSGVRATSHKWRYEGKGDSYLSISTDGVGAAGININNPSGNRDISWVETGPYWQISGGSFGVRLYSATLRPNSDNTMDFGTASFRGRVAYFGTGSINTSDGREKTNPVPISSLSELLAQGSDCILDAWGDVSIIAYRWLASLEEKGDGARWHFGVVAQQVRDAFLAHGIDGTRFGLLCFDKWDDEYEPVFEEWETEEWGTDESGRRVSYRLKHKRDTGKVRLVKQAGDRWGIRSDQCLFLEAEYQRRRLDRFEASVEARLALLEAK